MASAISKAFLCGAIAALTSYGPMAAGQNGPPTTEEIDAIFSALGIDGTARPASLQFWSDRDGGYVALPPEPISSNICVQERHNFVGSLAEGYSRFGPTSRSYRLAEPPNDCPVESSSNSPSEWTLVEPSISLAQVTEVISRTDEFLFLVSELPIDVDLFGERFLTEFWVEPTYIGSLERPSSSDTTTGDDILIANLPMGEDIGGIWVRFSIKDGEFTLHRIGQYSPPSTFAYQDEVWYL